MRTYEDSEIDGIPIDNNALPIFKNVDNVVTGGINE